MAITQEAIPSEWSDVVTALKGQVDNPYAVVNSMVAKGYQRKNKEGNAYNPIALHRRFVFDSAKQEANSLGTLGMLARKGVKPIKPVHVQEAAREHGGGLTWFSPFREADQPEGSTGKAQVVLIGAGCGNLQDGNAYFPEILQRDYAKFSGVRCFLNHPSTWEEEVLPERTVEGICGWFSNVRAESVSGVMSILAELNYMQLTDGQLTESGEKARGLCESAVVYQRQNGPDKCLLGLSINAEGPSHQESADMLAQKYPMFADALARRDTWNVVDGVESVTSVDLVTFPARNGRVLGLKEAQAFMESERWRASFRHALREGATPTEEGNWITVNGAHILINDEKGKSSDGKVDLAATAKSRLGDAQGHLASGNMLRARAALGDAVKAAEGHLTDAGGKSLDKSPAAQAIRSAKDALRIADKGLQSEDASDPQARVGLRIAAQHVERALEKATTPRGMA